NSSGIHTLTRSIENLQAVLALAQTIQAHSQLLAHHRVGVEAEAGRFRATHFYAQDLAIHGLAADFINTNAIEVGAIDGSRVEVGIGSFVITVALGRLLVDGVIVDTISRALYLVTHNISFSQ